MSRLLLPFALLLSYPEIPAEYRLHLRLFVRIILFYLLMLPAPVDAQDAATAERTGREIRARWPKEQPLDEAALRKEGVRRLEGKHLTLFTDLPADAEVDALPDLFDQLIPLLCDYFGLERKHYDDFHVDGFLIDDVEKFRSGGAVRQVPDLKNGYALRCRIWLRNQSSEYYRRHLLLHEGVHVFMGYTFGYWGPPWYREGTAELFGTHRVENGRLATPYYPKSRRNVPRWGRIEYIKMDSDKNGIRCLDDVFALGPEDYDANEAYAWSWAFAAFCEHHPRYRVAFRQTAWQLAGPTEKTAERFIELLTADLPGKSEWEARRMLENDWFDFVSHIEYDYDFERTVVEKVEHGVTLPPAGSGEVRVRADRGWQNSGFRLEKGKSYRFTATGRYRLADVPSAWWSEPNGVTVRYHRGAPLGMLQATLLPEDENPIDAPGIGLANPRSIGPRAVWTPDRSGTVYFRINDFASELSDNRGDAVVEIQRDGDVKSPNGLRAPGTR